MYKIRKIRVSDGDKLYGYCSDMCTKFKNLYNVTNFLIRQNMTGLKKQPEDRQPLETEGIQKAVSGIEMLNRRRQENYDRKVAKIRTDESMSESEKTIAITRVAKPIVSKFPTAKKWFIGYNEMEGILKCMEDSDYDALPKQASQQAVRQCIHDWDSYFASLRSYRQNPEKFTGKPKIVKYARNPEKTCILTNQLCRIRKNENGKQYLKLPGAEHKLWLGKCIKDGEILKQVEIIPMHGVYEVSITLETEDTESAVADTVAGIPADTGKHLRIAAIDLGVDNLAAITDNVGGKPIIVKGGAVKSRNQYANKEVSKLQSVLDKDDAGKDKSKKLTVAERDRLRDKIDKLWLYRNSFISDYFHKAAKRIVERLKDNHIGVLIVGHNTGWKQNLNIGHRNNQKFAYIPFDRFIGMLRHLCWRNGILFVENEESYTSKASFLDMDYIPTYRKDDGKHKFSGRRVKRGLYKSAGGILINADVNGSANILRKQFPDAFEEMNDFRHFQNVEVWRFKDFYQTCKCSPEAA